MNVNSFSFGNKNYEISDKKLTGLSESFANKFKELVSDGDLSEDDISKLNDIASKDIERNLMQSVVTLSKSGKASYDADSEGPMKPTEITFGTPKKNTEKNEETNKTQEVSTETKKTETKKLHFSANGEKFDYDVSPKFAKFFSIAANGDKGISPSEYQKLVEYAKKYGTKEDISFLDDLAMALDMNSEKGEGVKLSFRVDDGPEKDFLLKGTEVKAEGRGKGTFKKIFDTLIDTVTDAVTETVQNEGKNKLKNGLAKVIEGKKTQNTQQ